MTNADARAGRGTSTILLVEDQELVCLIVSRALRERGYEVLAVRSAETALTTAAKHDGPIDLLLTDVLLSDMTGVELCGRLREEGRVRSALFMSGYSKEDLPLTENDDFLQKPFAMDELLSAVGGLLAR